MYWTKYTEQNIPYRLQTNDMLDVSVRVSVRVWVRVSIRVSVRVSVRVNVSARIRVRVRAEWVTEESPKHPMAAYILN